MTYSVWSQFGNAISRYPEVTLAAYLGAPWAIARARAGDVPVPGDADFRRDPTFDPNRFRLKLPDEYLETSFLVRTLAFWGWRPLVDVAVICSEIQLERSVPAADAVTDMRLAAAAAAKAFQADPSVRNRAVARSVADACAAEYARFELEPDSASARTTWVALGACWFAAETAAQDFSLTRWDGPGPAAASSTWGNRNSVWPQRAAEVATEAMSFGAVMDRIAEAVIARSRDALEA
jgi:hypothetical protein